MDVIKTDGSNRFLGQKRQGLVIRCRSRDWGQLGQLGG